MRAGNNIVQDIQGFMKNFWGNSCYAWCLTKYFAPSETDLRELCGFILHGWRRGYIDGDCFVEKPIPFIESFCEYKYPPIDIRKIPITDLKELPEEDWIVEYKLNPGAAASHFVIANRKGVIFDPSGKSNTVQNGKPFTFRAFIYPKGKEWKGNIIE